MTPWPFTVDVLVDNQAAQNPNVQNHAANSPNRALPALYNYSDGDGRKRHRIVANPEDDVQAFLERELSLGFVGKRLGLHWFAGARRPTSQLHLQAAMGREIVAAERMDLHLLWESGKKVFLKPIPRYLLHPAFAMANLSCPQACGCSNNPPVQPAPCRNGARGVALGFLYTYACLISSEMDFFVANEKRLLPRKANDATIAWEDWKTLARAIRANHHDNKVHPRFLRPELRLGRINTIHRFTGWPPFDPFLRGWRTYGAFFRENLAWMAAATVFIALVLTAMQVGLAIDALKNDNKFQRASYGFTLFAILGPLGVFGLVILSALFNLVKDLPWLLTSHAPPPPPAAAVAVINNNKPPPAQGQHPPNATHPPGGVHAGNIV